MRSGAAGLLLAVALAACGGGDDGDDSSVPATTATTATTTAPTTTAAPTTTGCPPIDAAVASVDLDGDGTDEVWRSAGSGASADIVELVVVEGCEEVTVGQFAVGGSVRELHGIRCEGGAVTELVATSEDGQTYAVTEVTYELQGAELVETGRTTGELGGDDPALQAASTFDC